MANLDISGIRILFLSKKENEFANRAADYVRKNFKDPLIFSGDRKEKLPEEVLNWKGDLLVSFISSWIYPAALLSSAKMAAINFHPGSPEYPGTGCTNFAIYEGAKEYGVTCHHMATSVDAGKIIRVDRFPLHENDSVYAVTQQCYRLIERMFYELMDDLRDGKPLPVSTEQWKRRPYTRKELNELCEINPAMSADEIAKRVRATTYKTPWAYTKIGPYTFKLQA